MLGKLNGDEVTLHPDDKVLQGASDTEEVRQANIFLQALAKAVRAAAYYTPGHAKVHELLRDLSVVLRQYVDTYKVLTLTINEFEILLNDHLLYENHDLSSSLAFFLYRDGVRELRLGQKIEDWELQGLVEILKQASTANAREDDIVTLLWEREFLHIDFIAINSLPEDVSTIMPQSLVGFRERFLLNAVGSDEDIRSMSTLPDGSFDMSPSVKIIPTGKTTISSNWQQIALSLTPVEIERLRNELAAELSPNFLLSVVDMIFNFLVLEIKREPFCQALQYLLKCLDAQVTARDFRQGSKILQRVHQTIELGEMADWQIAELQTMLVEASDGSRIERVSRILEQDLTFSLDEMKAYLMQLNHTAIVPLIRMLGMEQRIKVRVMLCDVLVVLGKGTEYLFTPFMQPDQPWFLTRNLAAVLGHIGRAECIPLLRAAFGHPDPRVRREVIQALGSIGGTEAIRLLLKALHDEDSEHRGLAAASLGQLGTDAALNALLAEIEAKAFDQKASTEINRFFYALGVARCTQAIPLLQHYLDRHLIFGRKKADEMRAGAALALAKIGTQEALDMLQAGARSRHAAIRRACMHALAQRGEETE